MNLYLPAIFFISRRLAIFPIVICKEKEFTQSTLSLKSLEEKLQIAGFCLINQKYLVNREHITRYFKGDGGEVVLSNCEKLAASRGKKENLIQELKRKKIEIA